MALDAGGGAQDLRAAGQIEPIELGAARPEARTASPLQADQALIDAKIVDEAKDRFERCNKWEGVARQRFIEDYKFANGDSDNQYQWPNEIRRERDIDERPCLTVNKTRQHNLQIINDAKQNKPSIKVRATGAGASVASAKVLNAIMRHIEYKSQAQVAYDTATMFQVEAGIGYLRLVTDWESEGSFDQVPYIRRVLDPMTIYMDPEAKLADKSDAKFAFVFEDMDSDEFDKTYPQYKNLASAQALDEGWSWKLENKVRFAEYFRVVEEADKLYEVPRPQQQQPGQPPGPPPDPAHFFESELRDAPELLERLQKMPGVRARETKRSRVEWFLLVGSKIAEREVWPGKYIPIIPVIGEETIIEGQLDRKGHTRALRDAQRIYNYMTSIAVEYSGVQTKIPWITPIEAVEGHETFWKDANRTNLAYLPYNALDDAGEKIPAPQRVEPPVAMPAAVQGMQIASNEMMMVSGQYEASMGEPSNERSGKAINERERQGDTATYHYIDNLAVAIRGVGMQLLDLIPKLYTSRRVISILAEDGTSLEVQIDPQAAQAAQLEMAEDVEATMRVLFNPNVGKYDVQADIGPTWGTKRQETFNALSLILTQAPQLTGIIGDLLLKVSDFDLAEEASERLRRMVPPQALGQGPTQAEQQAMAQVQNLTSLLRATMEELAQEKIKSRGKDSLRDIEAYKVVTDRISGIVDAASKQGKPIDIEELKGLLEETVREAKSTTNIEDVVNAAKPSLTAASAKLPPTPQQPPAQGQLPLGAPPVRGARKAPDGNWYVRDRGGAFAKVR
jgi:hypothetical protein